MEGGPTETRRERRDLARRRLRARRRRLALIVAGSLAFAAGTVVGRGDSDEDGGEAAEPTAASPAPELPRGGTALLPRYRLVGFYGAPQDTELGALGIGTPEQATRALRRQAHDYRGNRPVMPVLELIAVTAAADPGVDGLYRLRQPHSVIREYLAAAREIRALLLLDIQPGRAEFEDEVERLDRYLREPDVGLALDPEWHVGDDEVPGGVIGSVDVETVDEISAELAATAARLDLPQKLFVLHRFTREMIDGGDPRPRRGLATVINIDGFGLPEEKVAKYEQLRPPSGSALFSGFKLFYNEDLDLMAPADVLALEPKPDLIVYE